MDDALVEHVAKSIHDKLREDHHSRWPTWEDLKECTQCMETAKAAITAMQSYKHTSDYEKTDEQGRPLTYWGGLKHTVRPASERAKEAAEKLASTIKEITEADGKIRVQDKVQITRENGDIEFIPIVRDDATQNTGEK